MYYVFINTKHSFYFFHILCLLLPLPPISWLSISSHPVLTFLHLQIIILYMESAKKVTSGSSSSFVDLFGPKDSSMQSSSSTGLFSSVFGPSSTVLFPFSCFSFSECLLPAHFIFIATQKSSQTHIYLST